MTFIADKLDWFRQGTPNMEYLHLANTNGVCGFVMFFI